MCGICGVLSRGGGAPVDPEVLRSMSAALAHRGPDSEGLYCDGPVGLAARRLAIIDLEHGDQPQSTPDGQVQVIQNGEIYNYELLREQLSARGHRFASSGDTEVLAHLYQEEGPRFVERLRGMFALALWDAPNQRLLLARDRFGIKPLHYRVDDRSLAFGSELKALRCLPDWKGTVDPDGLEAYLAFNSIPAPLTIYEGVRKLAPGHLLICERGTINIERYARPGPVAADRLRREAPEVLAQELRERLRDSVRAHLVSDVPVGLLLSGGIDSSALCALAAEHSPGRLRTFSIGFEERSFDELEQARTVAQRYGTDHHELIVRPDAAELLPRLAAAFDEPFGDSSALPTYLVCRLAAGSVKVALSGEGGDELFGGYETYVADLLAEPARRPAAIARPLVERLPSSSARVSLEYRAKRFVRGVDLPPLERHHAWKEIFSPQLRDSLRGRDAATTVGDPLDVYRQRYAETAGAEPLARLQDVDLGIYLVDDLLVKTDRMSMTNSLEVRVPFLDTAVSELALALPTPLKVRGLAKKRLLRRAVAPLVPRAIVRGRKKGFSIPMAAWLRGDLAPMAHDLLSPSTLHSHGHIEPEPVQRLLAEHADRRFDHSRQLWGLMCLSLWAEASRTQAPACDVLAGRGSL